MANSKFIRELFKDKYPEKYKLINNELNYKEFIESLSYGSGQKVWAICDKSLCGHHIWLVSIGNLTTTGCPFCAHNKVCECDSIFTVKKVMDIWDWEENKKHGLNPKEISKSSTKKIYCICNVHNTCEFHKFTTTPASLTRSKFKGNGCPYCDHMKVCPCDAFPNIRPDIFEYFDKDNNEGKDPFSLSISSGKILNWKCKDHLTCQGHKWRDNIANMNAKKPENLCSYCSGYKTCPCDSFMNTCPELAKQYDKERNKHRSPYKIRAGSRKRLWWLCEKGHSWKCRVGSRTKKHKTGCPKCKVSKLEAKIREILLEVKDEYNIIFKEQHMFDDCTNPKTNKKLRFDFKIDGFTQKCIIEGDGEQHFEEMRFKNKKTTLKIRQYRDKLKNEYCKSNNIHLLRVSYSEIDNIKAHITEFFKIIQQLEDYNEDECIIMFQGNEYMNL